MSAAYVTISCCRGEIRKFGGNRSDVKLLRDQYLTMRVDEFIKRHPYLTIKDYESLDISYRRKNR